MVFVYRRRKVERVLYNCIEGMGRGIEGQVRFGEERGDQRRLGLNGLWILQRRVKGSLEFESEKLILI